MAGTRTLSIYTDDLRTALGRPTENVLRVARWVNDALREIAYAFKFHAMEGAGTFNTVNGTVAYNRAADFRVMNGELRISAPQERFGGIILPETRTNYLRSTRYATSTNYGKPEFYHLYASQIWLRRTPDATVMTIDYDYWKKITPLAGDDDVSPLDEDWDEAIFRGAMYRGYLAHGEHDRAINMFQFYLGLVRSRVSEEDLEEFPEGGISYIQSQFDASIR